MSDLKGNWMAFFLTPGTNLLHKKTEILQFFEMRES